MYYIFFFAILERSHACYSFCIECDEIFRNPDSLAPVNLLFNNRPAYALDDEILRNPDSLAPAYLHCAIRPRTRHVSLRICHPMLMHMPISMCKRVSYIPYKIPDVYNAMHN